LSDRGFSKGPIAQAGQARIQRIEGNCHFFDGENEMGHSNWKDAHPKDGAPFWQRIVSLGKRTKAHKVSASIGERTALKTKTAVRYRANGNRHPALFSGIQYLVSSQA
jgi:hypothetical protein